MQQNNRYSHKVKREDNLREISYKKNGNVCTVLLVLYRSNLFKIDDKTVFRDKTFIRLAIKFQRQWLCFSFKRAIQHMRISFVTTK